MLELSNYENEKRCNASQHWFKRFSPADGHNKKGKDKYGLICERCKLVMITNQPLFQQVSY